MAPREPAVPLAAKRKRAEDLDASSPGAKKVKVGHGRAATAFAAPPSINQASTDVLAVLVFGNGDSGELGLGSTVQEARRPRLNPFLDPDDPSALHVVQLACGGMHTIALTKDNKIVTWGVNDNGALGRDTAWDGGMRDATMDGSDGEEEGELNPRESVPTPIPTTAFPPGTTFVQVAAGDSCSFALTDTGLVYGWGTFKDTKGDEAFGFDANGQPIMKQALPTQIHALPTSITQIACGANHALALDTNGTVWTWGCSEQNQLGRRLLGRLAANPYTPHPINIRAITHIASGDFHSLALDNRGAVWAWGLNSFGEAGYAKPAGSDEVLLPHPMMIPGLRGRGVVGLAGGSHHSAAVTADGQCLVWGRLDGGQLGIAFTPEQLRDGGLIRHDERGKPRICLRPTAVPGVGGVRHVACGTDHTVFVTMEGTAYSTGFNSGAQLGLGDYEDVEVARLVRGKALDGRVLTWAGAGGQFSVIAARSAPKAAEAGLRASRTLV